MTGKLMKRTYILVLAAIALATLSCNKEQDINTELPADEKGLQIVGVIHNPEDGVDVKTQYTFSPDEATATAAIFSWKKDDIIRLIVHKDNSFDKYDLWAQSTSPTSVFEDINYNEKTPIGSIITNEYDHTGYAIYPVGAPCPLSYKRGDSNTDVIITLPSEYTLTTLDNQLSMVPMIGVRSGSTNVYDFYAGVGVFAFNIANVPTTATQVRITSLDENKPLSGDFHLQANGSIAIDQKAGSNSASRTVNLPDRAGTQSITLYIPLPVGDIAANGIRIELLDGSDTPIFKRKYPNAFSIEQGVILRVNMETPAWKKLGTGKFIDNYLWTRAIDKDKADYVDVVIEQNTADHKKFRLVDPYGAAATKFGYSSTFSASRDSYLEFTVANPTTGSTVTNFTTHKTGIALDTGPHHMELMYPTTYSSDADHAVAGTFNKVVVGSESLPMIVQLAPVYAYVDAPSTAYNYRSAYEMDKHGVFRIMFPGVSGYGGNLSVPAEGNAQLGVLSVSKDANPARIICAVSTYTDCQIAAPQNNTYYVKAGFNGLTYTTSADNTGSWGTTGLATESNLNSGVVYLTWFTVDADEPTCVYDQGRTKMYYLNASDKNKYIGQYSFSTLKAKTANYTTDFVDIKSKSNTMTIAVSDNPQKGMFMLTEILGFNCDGTNNNTSLCGADPIITPKTGTVNFDGDYSAGNPQYGYFNGSGWLVFETDAPFFSLDGNAYCLSHGQPQYSTWGFTKTDSGNTITLTGTSSANTLSVVKQNCLRTSGDNYDESEYCIKLGQSSPVATKSYTPIE